METKGLFQMNYYSTYYYANILHNVLENPIDYLKSFEEFYLEYFTITNSFQKYSVLHQFIYYVVETVFYEDIKYELDKLGQKENGFDLKNIRGFWLNDALKFYDIDHLSFQKWYCENEPTSEHEEDIVYEYINDLYDETDKLFRKMSNEIFYLVFSNRKLMLNFNVLISQFLSGRGDIEDPFLEEDFKSLFKRNGVLKRIYIPKWVRSAVFFRDRGHCVFCNSDLTNLVSRLSEKNFDHIVPLNLGGINDISNIQLTCRKCNNEKRGGIIKTSNTYEAWY